MASDQDVNWDHRYYDSYRPPPKLESSSGARSPIVATASHALRHHSNKIWDRTKIPSNTTPQGDASSAPKFSRGQSEDCSPRATSVPTKLSPSTGHHSGQLNQKLTEERRDMNLPEAARSRRSSRTVDAHKRNESEAQSRGFYGSSRSPASSIVHLGRYELKRPLDDEATDDSAKRRRYTEDEADKEEDEPARASNSHRSPLMIHRCKNYMCMENHTYPDCDKPMICWGCRSTNHYWSFCPMTCTRCGAGRHTAKYCDEFELTQGEKGSMPRACGPHPPTEPAADRERKGSLGHEHGEIPLPEKHVKTVLPSRDGAERQQASHNIIKPRSVSRPASESRKSAPIEEGVSAKANDRHLQRLRDTSIPDSSPQGRTRTSSLSDQLAVLTQAPGKVSTSPSTQPNISPRDPRLRRGEPLTLRVSPLGSSQMPPEPGEVPSTEPQTPGEPAPKPSQHRPLGLLTTPLQAPTPQDQYRPQPPRRKDEQPSPAPTRDEPHPPPPPSAAPTKRPADDDPDPLDARMAAFEAEERVRQREHEAELARKKRHQRLEYERELEQVISKKRHAADMARRAAVQQQEDDHERRLAELRRR